MWRSIKQHCERWSFGDLNILLHSFSLPLYSFHLLPYPWCLFSLFHPYCTSFQLNYCRYCSRIWVTPTSLTGKVNKLLKMKNSTRESEIIYSFHLPCLILLTSPSQSHFLILLQFLWCGQVILVLFSQSSYCCMWFLLWFISLFLASLLQI